jgi:hypothetical protein
VNDDLDVMALPSTDPVEPAVPASLQRVLADVAIERRQQELLKAEGRFARTCSDAGMSNLERLAVLAEEFGEAARHVLGAADLAYDGGEPRDERRWLRSELVQVATVAVAWVEGLDAERAA